MDLARCKSFTLRQQIGHVTSEITRARIWEEKSDELSRQEALIRALDLIDLALVCSSQPRRREWARLREVVSDCFARTSVYAVSLSDLERHGLQFLAA